MLNRAVFFHNTAALGGGGITSSDADVTAWIAAVGQANTTQAEVNILTTMVAGIKSDLSISLLSSKFDRFWIWATGAQVAARVDLAARASITEQANGGTLTWTAQKGYAGDDTASYIDTGYNPHSGTNLTQNSAAIGIWVQTGETSASGPHAYAGAGSITTGAGTEFGRSGSNIFWSANQTNVASTNFAFSSQVGLWQAERSGATACTLYYNGSSTGSTNTTASSLQNADLFVLANANLSSGNAPSHFTNSTMGAFYTAGALGATFTGNVYTRLHTALNAINATNFP